MHDGKSRGDVDDEPLLPLSSALEAALASDVATFLAPHAKVHSPHFIQRPYKPVLRNLGLYGTLCSYRRIFLPHKLI